VKPARKAATSKQTDLLDNAAIAELLAREAEQASGQLRQAFRRAARKAFLWDHEAYDLLAAGKASPNWKESVPFWTGEFENGLKSRLPWFLRQRSGASS
jgi:hypothetical protein